MALRSMSNLPLDTPALPNTTRHANVPSFVDLRQFAHETWQGIPVAAFPHDDLFLANRRALDWLPGPVTAGVITLDTGSGWVASLPADEFIIVNHGRLTLTQQGVAVSLAANQSAVIQQGAAFSWSAQVPVSLIFIRYNLSVAGAGGIVATRENPTLEPTGTPPADLLLTPAPVCRNYTDYRTANGEFTCGTWDSTPYQRRSMFYRHFELMYLLEGSVTLIDEAGRSGTFSKGDIFLVEQTAQCSWESRVDVAKVYVIYRSA